MASFPPRQKSLLPPSTDVQGNTTSPLPMPMPGFILSTTPNPISFRAESQYIHRLYDTVLPPAHSVDQNRSDTMGYTAGPTSPGATLSTLVTSPPPVGVGVIQNAVSLAKLLHAVLHAGVRK